MIPRRAPSFRRRRARRRRGRARGHRARDANGSSRSFARSERRRSPADARGATMRSRRDASTRPRQPARRGATRARGKALANLVCLLHVRCGRARSYVRRGRTALVAVDQIAREHVLGLRIDELRLAREVAVQQGGGGRVEAVAGGHDFTLGALAVHGRAHAGGEHLAELDAPLIERVQAPDEALRRDAVLVERQELTGGVRVELGEQNG